jgi:hypothetical protein
MLNVIWVRTLKIWHEVCMSTAVHVVGTYLEDLTRGLHEHSSARGGYVPWRSDTRSAWAQQCTWRTVLPPPCFPACCACPPHVPDESPPGSCSLWVWSSGLETATRSPQSLLWQGRESPPPASRQYSSQSAPINCPTSAHVSAVPLSDYSSTLRQMSCPQWGPMSQMWRWTEMWQSTSWCHLGLFLAVSTWAREWRESGLPYKCHRAPLAVPLRPWTA